MQRMRIWPYRERPCGLPPRDIQFLESFLRTFASHIVCLYFEPFKSCKAAKVSERLKTSTVTPFLTPICPLKISPPKGEKLFAGHRSTIVQNFMPIGGTVKYQVVSVKQH